jgi:DNA-binding MarR family transcriptional regulator
MNRAETVQKIVEDISRMHRALKPVGIGKYQVSRAQIGMLFMVFYHKNTSMKDLASQMQISKSAVTQIMEPLIERGFISRSPLPSDRRVAILSLSSAGQKLLDKINTQRTESLRTAIGTLTDTELRTFYKLNSKINQSLVKE